MITLTITDSIPQLCLAAVVARGICIEPASEEIQEYSDRIVQSVVDHGTVGGQLRQRAIRDLLRSGGYKPAGRGKPAQEYLMRTAERDRKLPAIFNAVDLINVVSLCSGLPISLLALDRVGSELSARYGREGESYVFNSAEQTIDLKGLLCICAEQQDRSIPMGTPVKDSQFAKVTSEDRDVVAIIYSSSRTAGRSELGHWSQELASRFQRWCGAVEIDQQVISS